MVASIIGLSALTIECTKREAKNTRNDLAFDVNEKLLGDSYLDSISNMTLRVPIGWKDSDYNSDDTLKAKVSLLRHNSNSKKLYLDSLQKASLIVSYFNNPDGLNQIFANPDSAFNATKDWVSIDKSQFILNGQETFQFLLQNKNVINFKLLIRSSNTILQLDYFVDRAQYMYEVKKIESSIGSIRQLK
jgi:hypothetical protein